MLLHPATRIGIWLSLAAGVQGMQLTGLAALSFIFLLHPVPGFPRILKRTRWLLLSLLLIYGFASPGAPLLPQIAWASPSSEGLREGVLQAWRLLCLLAGVTWLLASTPRDELVSGLYQMLHPLIGSHAERCAVRLALTLHYAEQSADAKNRKHALPTPDAITTLSLRLLPFSARDALALTGAFLLLIPLRMA
ncbi:MAG: CbiQ family ECF transporter T component [Burkholderiales bacterium]